MPARVARRPSRRQTHLDCSHNLKGNDKGNAMNEVLRNVIVRPTYAALCADVAGRIAALIRRKPNEVLDLPTGSTPIGVYAELVRLHREEVLDYSQVTTFNLDEYFPMEPDAPQSYHRFMQGHLFDHVNCANWHVPGGRPRERAQVLSDCQR